MPVFRSLLALSFLATALCAQAAPLAFDNTFGSGGKTYANVIHEASYGEGGAGGGPAAMEPKNVACGLYLSGVWQYALEPNLPAGPRASVFGNPSPNDLRINNDAFGCENPTGTLRLEYWAVTSANLPAFRGGPFFGQRIAVFPANGQLFAGFSFLNINGTAPYTLPSYGTYWIVLTLSEFSTTACANADFYCTTDSITSFSQVTIGTSALSVSRNGTGGGTVTGLVGAPSPFYAIDCGATCQASIFGGYSVTLAAAPSAGSTFAGWSGACSGTGPCTLPMSSARSVTATFNVIPAPQTFSLSVTKSGNGTVTSSPAGINCGTSCSVSYNIGTSVSLTATPATGYSFTGWTLACAGTGSCNLTMNSNQSVTALFTQLPVVPPPAARVRSDFNGDGKSDFLYRNATTGQVYRMLMNGLAMTGAALAFNEPNTAWKIVGDADFNGDGQADLLYRNDATGQVYFIPFGAGGLPSGALPVMTEPNLAWKIMHTPDLNGDGKADLLWWNASTGQVYAMLMNGAAITAQGFVYTEPNTAWKIVATGDFAGSGKHNQLLWRNSTTGQVFMQTVTVAGSTFTQTGQVIYTEANTAWKILGAADFNNDTRSDILWRNATTGQVFVMLMNGPGITNSAVVHVEANLAWKPIAQGDYNGDGRADLLWRNETTGQVYLMLMSGLTVSSQAMIYTEPNIAWKIPGPWEYGQASGVLAGIVEQFQPGDSQ